MRSLRRPLTKGQGHVRTCVACAAFDSLKDIPEALKGSAFEKKLNGLLPVVDAFTPHTVYPQMTDIAWKKICYCGKIMAKYVGILPDWEQGRQAQAWFSKAFLADWLWLDAYSFAGAWTKKTSEVAVLAGAVKIISGELSDLVEAKCGPEGIEAVSATCAFMEIDKFLRKK